MIAIVPLKRHSERVKDKNLRLFNGKPLYWYIFNTLFKTNGISKVYLTCDNHGLAQMVKSDFPKLEVLMRPEELIGDNITANALIGHVLSHVKGDHFLYTHATNPLLKAKTIEDALVTYHQLLPIYDSLMSVNKLQARLYSQWSFPINHDPHVIVPSQKLEPIFEDNSNMYMFNRDGFEKNGRVGKNPFLYVMDRLESIDIDEEADFRIAEVISREL